MPLTLTSLVVCADARAVQVLSRILREMGIRAEHCGDYQKGADRLAEDHFDAFLVDFADEVAANALVRTVRGGTLNRDSLAIAIVDVSNNVREIFVNGVNFALYKPVSPERAGNSLRSARALMANERRRQPRVAAHGPVSIAYAGTDNVPAELLDLSEDGIAIKAERALPPSCKVYFEFKLPEETTVIRLSGEVVWTDFMGRVGLQFARVPQASRQVLDGWLRESLFRQLEAGTVPPSQEDQQAPAADSASERRSQFRVTCQLGAEIYPAGSKVPHRCNLSDISQNGCYVETMQPLPAGTLIDILVRTKDIRAHLKGKVRSAHPGYGMGVEFYLQTNEQQRQVKHLIAWQAAHPGLEVERF